jgi:hypothetical protein
MREIHHIIVPVGRCTESAPQGVAAESHYLVTGNTVQLCDAEGHTTGAEATLKAGDDHRTIAARLVKHRWQDERGAGDFDRPLSHRDYEWQCPC